MRLPFKRTGSPTEAPQVLDPGLAAEQRRRVVEWARADAAPEPAPEVEDDAEESGREVESRSASDL
jgi:hypothetical protein